MSKDSVIQTEPPFEEVKEDVLQEPFELKFKIPEKRFSSDIYDLYLEAGVPPEILDLPHLPKMHFYPIFRHKNAILPPVLAFPPPSKMPELKKTSQELQIAALRVVGCQGVKVFSLKDVIITTSVTTVIFITITI